MVELLKYGNTNTYYISSGHGGILVDTDWAWTLPAFYKAIKGRDIRIEDISYLVITHYHPDHMGLAGELVELGIKLVALDLQWDFIHCSDSIFQREKNRIYKPIADDKVRVISCSESRCFLEELSIRGEIIHTPGHSGDSVSVILDEGIAIVGDLEPIDNMLGYHENDIMKGSWQEILSHGINTVFYGHANKREIKDPRSLEDFFLF